MTAKKEIKTKFEMEKAIIKGFKCIREPLVVDTSNDLSILVGDNGVGKSTILEAIHLALTGTYRGEQIRRSLSEALFNNADVAEFVNMAKNGSFSNMPEIKIEIFFTDVSNNSTELLSGAVNSERCKHCGFTFTIRFNEDYRSELESLTKERLQSLPVEYYNFEWMTFAGEIITPYKIPLRSILINPAGEWRSSHPDEYAAKLLLDGLEKKHQMAIAQDARIILDQWKVTESLEKANGKLPEIGIESFGNIDIAASCGSVDSWKRSMVVRLENVPYSHIGAGAQSIVQTAIALSKEQPEKSTLLLFEEPENHLSHTNLNKLIQLISEGADGRKVIITTHSSYVANILGLEHLQIVGRENEKSACSSLSKLKKSTFEFFKKLPGYDTLRLVLSKSAILVEGPSDELIVQLAYRNSHKGNLPIQNGIDVLSVGSGFLRFLELANSISKPVLVLTDNDGKPENIKKKYTDYLYCNLVKIGYVEEVYQPNDPCAEDKKRMLNWNTLEAEMLRANGLEATRSILNKPNASEVQLLKYMENNKTVVALKFFDSNKAVKIPQYIDDGLRWLDGKS